jgi:hypothetical protein
MSTLTTRQLKERAERDARALEALHAEKGREMTCQEVGEISGLSMMASYWALRRLVSDGKAVTRVRPVELPDRQGELTAVFRAVQELMPPDPWPSWLCGTVPPAFDGRRVVMGRSGLLAPAPRKTKERDDRKP